MLEPKMADRRTTPPSLSRTMALPNGSRLKVTTLQLAADRQPVLHSAYTAPPSLLSAEMTRSAPAVSKPEPLPPPRNAGASETLLHDEAWPQLAVHSL